MTLRQKHSRRICINKIYYRWVVRDRPTYTQAVGLSNLSVAVERVDAPNCVLRIVLPATRQDNWLLVPGYVIKPSDLSRWIPKALAAGWLPHKPGSGFELRLTMAELNADQCLGGKNEQRSNLAPNAMSIPAWTLLFVADCGFCYWVLCLGGAEWLEGWRSFFLIEWATPQWTAEQIKLYSLLCWIGHTLWFFAGLFEPGLRSSRWFS